MVTTLFFSFYTLAYSYDCVDSSQVDFTYYCFGGTDDWIVSSNFPNGASAIIIPNLPAYSEFVIGSGYIWDSTLCAFCNITTTKSFFVAASVTQVNLDLFGDNHATAYISNIISCKASYPPISKCDITGAIKLGINELKIEAQNDSGYGALAYKLEIRLPL